MKRKWVFLGLMIGLLLSSHAAVDARSGGAFGGGGVLVGQLAVDLGDLNTMLEGAGFEPLEGRMLVFGGGGAGGTLDWNIGGWGCGGQVKSSNASQEATLALGLGGLSFHRTVPLGSALLSGGLLLGGGVAELALVHRENPSLEEAIAGRYESTFQNEFLAAAPTVGIRVHLSDLILLHAEGGYLATLGEWKFQGRSMSGLPKIGGPLIRIGVELGGSTLR